MMKIIGAFLMNKIVLIHAGGIAGKLKATFVLSVILTPFVGLIDRLTGWYITNTTYVELVMGAIFIDHVIGTLYHLIKGDFSWKKNAIGLIVKISLVVGMAYIFEALTIMMGNSFVKTYSLMALRITVFMYPAMSAIGNSSTITGGKFPPKGLIKKLIKLTKWGKD